MRNYLLKGKVVLLNAPPETGKDFAANAILATTFAKHCEFKSTIHDIALAITGLDKQEYFNIYNNRELKEVPNEKFLGKSPREMMIWISESVCKPEFGKLYFGKAAANILDLERGSVFSDSGFPDEVFPLADRVGPENIYIVRFTRGGATFDNDSRNYLQPEDCPKGVNFIDLKNDGCIGDFVTEILNKVVGV